MEKHELIKQWNGSTSKNFLHDPKQDISRFKAAKEKINEFLVRFENLTEMTFSEAYFQELCEDVSLLKAKKDFYSRVKKLGASLPTLTGVRQRFIDDCEKIWAQVEEYFDVLMSELIHLRVSGIGRAHAYSFRLVEFRFSDGRAVFDDSDGEKIKKKYFDLKAIEEKNKQIELDRQAAHRHLKSKAKW